MANNFTGAYNAAGGAASGLNADDFNYFRAAADRINQAFSVGSAQNQFQRQTSDINHGNNLNNLAWQYGQLKRNLASPYARAGTLNSGLYRNAWDTARANYNRSLGNLNAAYNQQQQGFNLADNQLLQQKNWGIDDVESARAARQAAAAAYAASTSGGF